MTARVIAAVRHELGCGRGAENRLYLGKVPQLPKTRSGKILRNLLRTIVNGGACVTPPTIEDPAVPAQIEAVLQR